MSGVDLRKAALLAAGSSGAGPAPPSLAPLTTSRSLQPVQEGGSPLPSPHALGQPSDAPAAGQFVLPPPRVKAPIGVASWSKYWAEKQLVDLPERGGKFNLYTAGPADGPLVFLVHGGGYTGLTWSLVVGALKEKYHVVAADMRGHGETTTSNDLDFSKETMTEDIIALVAHCVAGRGGAKTPTVLVGHSMGGGLVVWAAASKRVKDLEGVVVIDVVEGTAIAALPHMHGVLNSRPSKFPAVDDAIAWALRTGMCRSKEAVAVSLPSQLRTAAGISAAAAAPSSASSSLFNHHSSSGSRANAESSASGLGASGAGSGATGPLMWRTPLTESQPYWEGWYRGLSEAFLAVPGPKMLLLAGTDRLDKVLTIGQMQGKFQLVLMPTAGHAIQEDEGKQTAEHLLQFLKRFRVGEPPLQFPKAMGVRPVLPIVAGPTL